jgi:PPM family protein phosphatase
MLVNGVPPEKISMGILFAPAAYRARRITACAGINAAFCQCVGDRDEQQDACGVFARGASLLAVVADGMGGLARGGDAAQIAVRAAELESERLMAAGASFESMRQALIRVNDAVYRSVESFGSMGMSGTTLCVAVVERLRLRLFWCGDSRAYLWRGGELRQLTEDHVYARYLKEMVAEGVITVADARTHPARGRLTGYVGMRALEDYSVIAEPLVLQGGDGLLLCTDGLYKCLGAAGIARCMGGGAKASAGTLIRAIVKKRLNGQDNATALVLKCIH